MNRLVGLLVVAVFASFLFGCGGVGTSTEKPLFTLMDSSETGFFFWNEIYEKPALNGLNYGYFYNGGGVAIGDVNNDDLPDVYMVGNTFGGRLYVNDGNLKFHQITNTSNTATDGFTHGVTMADVNQDGFLDIYLSRSMAAVDSMRANRLLINKGNGTFVDRAKEYGVDDMGFSTHANFFDYDQDGDLDLYVLNHSIDYDLAMGVITKAQRKKNIAQLSEKEYMATVSKLYRNNGDQTFTDVTAAAGMKDVFFGLSATASDINNDGWLDLYCTSDFADKDHLYINNKNGTFTDVIHDAFGHISQNSMGSDIADMNNDGLLDIITLDMMAEDNYRNKQLKGNNPYDLFQMSMEYGYHCQVMRNCLQLNNGDGTFSEIGQLAGISHTDWSWAPLFADFDNDGKKDLFISNGYFRDLTDMDYMNYESNEIIRKAGGKAYVENMKLLEGINSTPIQNYVYQNEGNFQFKKRSDDWGLKEKSFSNGAAYADLDLDGDLDLIVNNFGQASFLYRNNATEHKAENKYLSFTFEPKQHALVQGTKLTLFTDSGKQYQQLINNRGYLSTMHQLLHFGLGKDNKVSKVEVEYPNGMIQEIKSPKLNSTIRLDMTKGVAGRFKAAPIPQPLLEEIPNAFIPALTHTESAFIDFKDEPLLEQMYSNRGPYVAVADVNKDGLDDIYFGASAGYKAKLYIQLPNATFKQKTIPSFIQDKAYEDGRSIFFDADGDQDMDLYVTSGSNEVRDSNLYINRFYKNDGQGNFERAQLPSIRRNTVAVKSLDVDADGDLDLVVGGNVKPKQFPFCYHSYVLINNGQGEFKPNYNLLPKQGQLGIVHDIAITDINADGKQDIILAGDWMPITLLQNEGTSFEDKTANYGLANSSGMWNSLCLVDINKDKKLDIVAGNRGTNSFFKCDPSHPATMYVNDFDRNGETEGLVNYYFGDGVLYPKYSLNEVLEQLPSWRGLFTSYAKYSAATSAEIFSDEKYAGTKTYTCKNLESSVFINEGKTFSARSLPIQAQFSQLFGLSAISRTNERPIIWSGGNNNGVDVNTGRSDAGYGAACLWQEGVLKPYTDKTLPMLLGEVRDLVSVNTSKNYNLLLVSRNGAPPLVYKLLK